MGPRLDNDVGGDFPDSCLTRGRYPADGHLTIACYLPVSCAERRSGGVGKNVRVRKLLIGVLGDRTATVVGAVGTDFGAAIYAEYSPGQEACECR